MNTVSVQRRTLFSLSLSLSLSIYIYIYIYIYLYIIIYSGLDHTASELTVNELALIAGTLQSVFVKITLELILFWLVYTLFNVEYLVLVCPLLHCSALAVLAVLAVLAQLLAVDSVAKSRSECWYTGLG